jgi:hypothetical protein
VVAFLTSGVFAGLLTLVLTVPAHCDVIVRNTESIHTVCKTLVNTTPTSKDAAGQLAALIAFTTWGVAGFIYFARKR